jgi:D-glycero-alpha-D-manno-heptose 1-phosphate guanylyltransferase
MSAQALVLAGGLGTRLRTVVADRPKVLAPVAGRPFLEHLLADLDAQGFRRVILAVGHLREMIVEAIGSSFRGLSIAYSEEERPLGTGGAIARGLALAAPGPCFVLNGDTWLEIDYAAMLAAHQAHGSRLTMAVRAVPDVSRFGALTLSAGRVARYAEKGAAGPGHINAGTYLLDRSLLADHGLGPAFSLERDFLVPRVAELRPLAFVVEGEFVDIGVPGDYARAQEMFAARGSR